ncbi:hypothetical protein P170DRAFT_493031 [Aspergillus steynii IBT 23096]|uniref:CFEM domain-containing protein n=1 Tax=Aspergillus steynii IBT 23096 TaxID=1392250 RepID=A0A2I2GDC7_9EURO|nr:uncharacterized protein P170DRAFT_493031 [Aspergillus steynii IBT 23096]PLB50889.1 hypothetical protein P170DRAFT_493031 [Aspergillus steynii IBT 23096]
MNSTISDGFLGGLATCATDCFTAVLKDFSCSATDQTCICTNETIMTNAIGCFSLQCTPKDNLASTNATRAACGVPEESQADLTPGLAGGLGMMALIMVVLRLLQRTCIKKSFGWDDGLILMALVMKKYGLGTNIWTIPFGDITKQLKLLLLAEVFYMPSEAFTQLSFLTFYLRIFPPSKYQYIAYALGVLSVCFGTSNTLIMIFQCTPVSFFWTNWTGETTGSCIDISAYSWYRAAMQIAMDMSIIALPLWPLSTLQITMSKRKKTLIMLMFCTGFLITVVSCLRLQSLIKFSKSANISMDNNPAIYWSIVECDVAIICACMPCIPSLFKPLFPSCFGDTRKNSNPEDATPPPIRMERKKRKEDFSILHTTASEDALVNGR